MTNEYFATQWGAVDAALLPSAYTRYLDAVGSLDLIRQLKTRSYDLLRPCEGHRLLDLGCGLGDDARALASRIGAIGRVVGIDLSHVMITEARKRSEGLDLPVEFAVADLLRTGLPGNSFDGCRAERVFVHLADPASALAEMVRLTKPGGQLVVLDADWETLVVDSKDRAVTRKLLHFFCDTGESRWIGRQLRRLFIGASLEDISISADTLIVTDLGIADTVFKLVEMTKQALEAGVVSDSEADSWSRELKQADERGEFYAALTMFCISGTKRCA